MDQVDFSTLTHEQLVYLVQVRGQAIAQAAQADNTLWDKLASSSIQAGDFEAFMDAKQSIMAGLATAEEKILAGHPSDIAVN